MVQAIFETAAIADSIRKASSVSPNRGRAYDRFGGIIFELVPDEEQPTAIIRATNGEVFYMEWLSALQIEGDARVWRLPSALFSSILNSLPIGSGKTVKIEEVPRGLGSYLQVSSGRVKAKVNIMDSSLYPHWDAFDPDDLMPITDLGSRITKVEWAALKTEPPLSGMHFTGNEVLATDRYRLAVMPCVVEHMPHPITVPAGLLGSILKQTGDVGVGFSDTQMLLMPNDTTQVRVTIYDAKYPGVAGLMNRERPQRVTVGKTALQALISRVTVAVATDRLPALNLFFGKGEIAAMAEDQNANSIGDVLEIPGQADHPRVKILISPKNLVDTLQAAPGETVTIGYDISNPMGLIHVTSGPHYEVWFMVRRNLESNDE